MDCNWLKLSPSLIKGIASVNKLDEARFDQFLRRIVSKLRVQDAELFTEEERTKLEKIFNIDQEHLILSIKTLQHIFRKILKYIFMPNHLKIDLNMIGLSEDKADSIVKVWAAETRAILDAIGPLARDESDTLQFTWNLNAELSSDIRKKCKVPKAYITLTKENSRAEMELTHPDLYSIFYQFESIQNMLDNLVTKH